MTLYYKLTLYEIHVISDCDRGVQNKRLFLLFLQDTRYLVALIQVLDSTARKLFIIFNLIMTRNIHFCSTKS